MLDVRTALGRHGRTSTSSPSAAGSLRALREQAARTGRDPKGKNTAALFGNDQVACGLAVYDLLQSTYTAIGSTRSGNLPIATLGWGLALLDLIDMGNSCTPVQQAWYEAFYRQHTIRIRQIRQTAAPGMTMP